MSETALIAVDWGTSRFRAYRLGPQGAVLERADGDDGISSVPPGGFPAVLQRHCGAWMSDAPSAPVVMAGMVGSRNGWAEATYASCPASPASLAGAMLDVSDRVFIIPGVITRGGRGPDVMRGEETLVFGTEARDGLVCLPGTHSKWVKLEGGAIVDLATFMTGECYGLFRSQSLLARLATEPEDLAGFDEGLAAAADEAGLLNRLFQARARVLDGSMDGAPRRALSVRPAGGQRSRGRLSPLRQHRQRHPRGRGLAGRPLRGRPARPGDHCRDHHAAESPGGRSHRDGDGQGRRKRTAGTEAER